MLDLWRWHLVVGKRSNQQRSFVAARNARCSMEQAAVPARHEMKLDLGSALLRSVGVRCWMLNVAKRSSRAQVGYSMFTSPEKVKVPFEMPKPQLY